MELSDKEKKYNEMFGSFRSSLEGFFGEIGTIFEKNLIIEDLLGLRIIQLSTCNSSYHVYC